MPPPQHGYDVLVRIVRATDLPRHDWWNGRADPYVIMRATPPDNSGEHQYRTRTHFRDLNPEYDEFFELINVPEATCLSAEVWDKDILTQDDVMGRASWVFVPQQLKQNKRHTHRGVVPLKLQLHHPTKPQKEVGKLELSVHYQPSLAAGSTRMLGPVRFTQCFSPRAGFVMGRWNWNDDSTMSFSVWKLFLVQIPEVFGDVRHRWNQDYAKAAQIYRNPMVLQGIRTQHAALYATHLGRARCGVLCNAADFFAAFGGQRRYFTYSLMPDSFRCSETGAQFFVDLSSKHAMHANASEEVLFAGEFCILPDEDAAAGYRLILDNNSGTFAPKKEHLPLMKKLFEENFPGIVCETVDSQDPKLKEYHKQCPSRLSAEAAKEAAKEVSKDGKELSTRGSAGKEKSGKGSSKKDKSSKGSADKAKKGSSADEKPAGGEDTSK